VRIRLAADMRCGFRAGRRLGVYSSPRGHGSGLVDVDEDAWTVELRDALLKFGEDDTVAIISAEPKRICSPGIAHAEYHVAVDHQ
jgi:hypothetical protein